MDMGSHEFRGFDAADVEAALRPLGWNELCARLVAAQDYRRSMKAALIAGPAVPNAFPGVSATDAWPDAASASSPGSFHGGTARMLDHFDKGKRDINSTSSTYGKDSQGTPVDSRPTSLSAFAERQADENSHD